MGEAALDEVFIDEITVPASDGYLLAATLFLPRRAKTHAVLINSAAAVPRKIYRGFAGYLAQQGCAVLTYDYRGTGDSRPKAAVGDKRNGIGHAAVDFDICYDSLALRNGIVDAKFAQTKHRQAQTEDLAGAKVAVGNGG